MSHELDKESFELSSINIIHSQFHPVIQPRLVINFPKLRMQKLKFCHSHGDIHVRTEKRGVSSEEVKSDGLDGFY